MKEIIVNIRLIELPKAYLDQQYYILPADDGVAQVDCASESVSCIVHLFKSWYSCSEFQK